MTYTVTVVGPELSPEVYGPFDNKRRAEDCARLIADNEAEANGVGVTTSDFGDGEVFVVDDGGDYELYVKVTELKEPPC